jgi:hypothetical protein
MSYKKYKFVYFNILLISFVLFFNNVYILLILFMWKLMFLFNLYSDTYIEFFHPVKLADFYNFDNKYVEADHEDPDFYIMFYQEFYSLCNCRFSFDIFGGSQTLDDTDFIDVNLYLDRRNLKNVYKNINFKYINKNDYILYHFDDDNVLNYRNINVISKFDNLDIYNIEFNPMLKDKVNADKRIKYLRIVRDNTQNINEKNI